jgi:7-keto-8-aminopelargonate synthetase-like enzyme
MATPEDLLTAVDEAISDGVRRGLLHNHIEDDALDGRLVTVHGRRLVNFGSCSYLGLETDPRMKAAVRDAVDRYGTQFSSSRTYASAPLYRVAEEELTEVFGRPVIVAPSTSIGHIATMPTLVTSRDVLLLDHQVHHSVQTAATLVQAGGALVELLPHCDLRVLEQRLETHRDRRVWYATDGLYSMYADFFPARELDDLAARYENLWLYVDDAHSASWTGTYGRGYALEQLSPATLAHTVVAASLNKSFAGAGGAITFPDEESRRLVMSVGGPLIFSGPVQPPMLGAIVASARLHRSPELPARQELLRSRIRLFNRLAAEAAFPVVAESEAPIRFVGAGVSSVAYRLTARMREAGFFVNTATFPAVPAKRSGARLALTLHHTEDDVADVVAALARNLPLAMADEGATVEDLRRAFARQLRGRDDIRPARAPTPAPAPSPVPKLPVPRAAPSGLRLEQSRSIAAVDPVEWDALLGHRSVFDVGGLRALEEVFAGHGVAGRDEDAWDFTYLVVRDDDGTPVAATFLTTALWKDDMLSPAHVSREVERRRAGPAGDRFLTSAMVGTGSLLTEGDHLYLDRSRDWQTAVRMILQAARVREDAVHAAAVVLRDLPDGDDELHTFLLGEGLLRLPVPDSWVRPVDFADDEGFLAGLTRKHRYHQRTRVLPNEPAFDVEVLEGGSPEAVALPALVRDHLYRLYRAVHGRAYDLNVLPMPRRLIDAVLASPAFEVVLLRLPEMTGTDVVAFAVQHVGGGHVAPLFVGLDYAFVSTHASYQVLLLQALRSALRRGARLVRFGMGADLQKARFGAHREKRWAYVAASETFNADVLARLAETVAAS